MRSLKYQYHNLRRVIETRVFNGFLCLTRLDGPGNCEGKIEFLAMKKYGYVDSWVTMFVISNIPIIDRYGIIEPLFTTEEGEVLVSMYMSGTSQNCNIGPSVKSYDVNGNFLRDISISTKNDHFKVILYEETWASPHVYDEVQRKYDLSKLEDSYEEVFRLRVKKRNKKIEKKNHQIKKKVEHSQREHCWSTRIEFNRRKEERTRNKRNYGSKCSYIHFHLQHDFSCYEESHLKDNLKGNGIKIKKRASHIPHKPSVVGELYTSMRPCSYFDISEDLIIDIASRLPLKTLAHFKCVSKQWKKLILESITVKCNSKLLIISHLENKYRFHSLDQQIRVERICSPLEERLLGSVDTMTALSSCNGLLLIEINRNLVVWNPLTKFIKKVSSLYPNDDYNFQIDLCFDYANNEYKVVALDKNRWSNQHSENFMVATFGACYWKGVDVPFIVRNAHQGPSFKGYRHWFCKSCISPRDQSIISTNHIMYFDPSMNKLTEVPMPQYKKFDAHMVVGLGVLDECLCMTRCPENYEGNTEFLKMKEYGNGNSWDVMFVISNVTKYNIKDYMVVPLFKTKEGEVLVSIHEGYMWSVKVYDYNGRFRRDVARNNDSYSRFVLLEESWFSPDENLTKCYD